MNSYPSAPDDIRGKEGKKHSQIKWWTGVTSREDECAWEMPIGKREVDSVGCPSLIGLNSSEWHYQGTCYPVLCTRELTSRRVRTILRHGFQIRPSLPYRNKSLISEEVRESIVDWPKYRFDKVTTQYGEIFIGNDINLENYIFEVNGMEEFIPEKLCGYFVKSKEDGAVIGKGWKITPVSTGDYYVGKFLFDGEPRYVYSVEPDGSKYKISNKPYPHSDPISTKKFKNIISKKTVYRRGPMAGIPTRKCGDNYLPADLKAKKQEEELKISSTP